MVLGEPAMDVDSNGVPHFAALFTEPPFPDGNRTEIRYFTPGGEITTVGMAEQMFSQTGCTGTRALMPAIDVGEDDTIVIAWLEQRCVGPFRLLMSKLSPGATEFTEPEEVVGVINATQVRIQVAVRSDGAAQIVVLREILTEPDINGQRVVTGQIDAFREDGTTAVVATAVRTEQAAKGVFECISGEQLQLWSAECGMAGSPCTSVYSRTDCANPDAPDFLLAELFVDPANSGGLVASPSPLSPENFCTYDYQGTLAELMIVEEVEVVGPTFITTTELQVRYATTLGEMSFTPVTVMQEESGMVCTGVVVPEGIPIIGFANNGGATVFYATDDCVGMRQFFYTSSNVMCAEVLP